MGCLNSKPADGTPLRDQSNPNSPMKSNTGNGTASKGGQEDKLELVFKTKQRASA